MLVLTMKTDEEIVAHLPDGREIVLVKVDRRKVGIEAPQDIRVTRRPAQPRLKLVRTK